MSTRKKRNGIRSWITYLILAITGGGVGGYQISDHPIVQKLLKLVQEEVIEPDMAETVPLARTPETETKKGVIASLIKTGLTQALDPNADYRKGGIFEVRVDQLKVDPSIFKRGRTVDLQVRVRKIDSKGREGTIWDSEEFGERLAQVGRDDLSASWSQRPFRVAWQPGDQFLVEVWDKSGWTKTRWFVMDEPDGQEMFPLRSGDHNLSLVARKLTPQDRPEENALTLSSKRVGDLPEGTGPSRTAAVGGRTIR